VSTQFETVQALLGTTPYGRMGRLIGKTLYWRFRIFEQRKYEHAVLERIEGLSLLVTPGVLNPRLMRTGAFFAAELASNPVSRDAEVLDMGTGSGVCALVAGRSARHAVAVDIDDSAVRCARMNVMLNRMENTIDVLQGDLFGPLNGQRFDLVMFNPPFVQGVPRNDADRAWRSMDVAERFAAGLRDHLQPGGSAFILLSTYGHPHAFTDEFRRHDFKMTLIAQRRYINETLVIFKLT